MSILPSLDGIHDKIWISILVFNLVRRVHSLKTMIVLRHKRLITRSGELTVALQVYLVSCHDSSKVESQKRRYSARVAWL